MLKVHHLLEEAVQNIQCAKNHLSGIYGLHTCGHKEESDLISSASPTIADCAVVPNICFQAIEEHPSEQTRTPHPSLLETSLPVSSTPKTKIYPKTPHPSHSSHSVSCLPTNSPISDFGDEASIYQLYARECKSPSKDYPSGSSGKANKGLVHEQKKGAASHIVGNYSSMS